MSYNSYESFLYAIIFLVPGYIMNSAYENVVNSQRKAVSENLLRFLVFSLLNYAFGGVVIFRDVLNGGRIDDILNSPIYAISILIVIPYIAGVLLGFFSYKGWGRKVFRKIEINTMHPNPTAWDYLIDKPAWLSVTLKNGTIIHGYFGGESFAATSSETPQDLFMQRRCKFNDVTKKFEDVEPSTGIWIPYNEIQYMEVALKNIEKKIK